MTNLENKLITLDPRDESDHGPALRAPRPHTLDGKTLGLLSNNKPHSEELLQMMAENIKKILMIEIRMEQDPMITAIFSRMMQLRQ